MGATACPAQPGRGHGPLLRAHTREHIGAMKARADAVFNGFLDLVGRPQRRRVLWSTD